MIDPELLAILVCPETKEPVRLADGELLERINRAITSGALSSRNGDRVEEPIDGALVRDDGRVFYPIRDDIPIMLIDESVELQNLPDGSPSSSVG